MGGEYDDALCVAVIDCVFDGCLPYSCYPRVERNAGDQGGRTIR